jgi:hypothetical protein
MDDLKLIAKSEKELKKRIRIIKNFSDDIHMEFGLENVPRLHMREANYLTRKIQCLTLTEIYKSYNRKKRKNT